MTRRSRQSTKAAPRVPRPAADPRCALGGPCPLIHTRGAALRWVWRATVAGVGSSLWWAANSAGL